MAFNNSSSCPVLMEINPKCLVFAFVSNFVVNVVIGLFGSIGNILAVATLFRDSKKNVTSLLLVVLAIGDTTQIWSFILFKSLSVLCDYQKTDAGACYYRMYIWPYTRVFGRPVYMFGLLLSNWTVVLVTIHRAMAIMRPHKAKDFGTIPRVRIQCSITALLATIMAVVISFEEKVTQHPGCTPNIDVNYTPLKRNRIYTIIVRHLLINGFGKVLPILLLIILTVTLVGGIRKASKQSALLGRRGQEAQKQEHQLTVLLISVAVVFLLCQIPHVTLYGVPVGLMRCPEFGYYYQNITDNLAMLNVSINFVLYCLVGNRFRRMLAELCTPSCVKKLNKPVTSRTSVTLLTPNTEENKTSPRKTSLLQP